MQGSNAIKAEQLALITFITQTGIGIIMLPSELAKVSGHDGWISILITGGIVLILSGLILSLLHRYKNKSIFDINRLIFGKFISIVLNTILLLYLLAFSVLGISIFVFFMRVTLLPKTPAWILSMFTLMPSFYLIWKGLKDMSRYLYISAFNYLVIIFLPLLLLKEAHWSFLLPVGEAGLPGILEGILPTFFSFAGFELIAFFNPYVTEPKKVTRWYVGASLASTAFFLSYTVLSTVILGENALKVFALPFFNLIRLYRAPIFERLDLYVTAIWYIPMACSLRSYIFACYDGILKVYKLKKSKLMFILFFLLTTILGSLPDSINSLIRMIMMANMVGMSVCGFLVLCLLLSFIRKKGVVTG